MVWVDLERNVEGDENDNSGFGDGGSNWGWVYVDDVVFDFVVKGKVVGNGD